MSKDQQTLYKFVAKEEEAMLVPINEPDQNKTQQLTADDNVSHFHSELRIANRALEEGKRRCETLRRAYTYWCALWRGRSSLVCAHSDTPATLATCSTLLYITSKVLFAEQKTVEVECSRVTRKSVIALHVCVIIFFTLQL